MKDECFYMYENGVRTRQRGLIENVEDECIQLERRVLHRYEKL